MGIIDDLVSRQNDLGQPFLISWRGNLSVRDVLKSQKSAHLSEVLEGQVVALIGDFDSQTIADFLTLLDRKACIVPLTPDTEADHDYFMEISGVQWIVAGGVARPRSVGDQPALIRDLGSRGHAGLVLFTSGTTGRPKAILHDFEHFLKRYRTPRPSLKTLAFLQFDHIGGINTLLHTMFNNGRVVVPSDRSPATVLEDCRNFDVEVLPATPTFLRMLWMSGLVPEKVGRSLRVITYGTERMDQETLGMLSASLPHIDFRQTYGMSELGILRVKSLARDSLWMKIGGEGVETRVEDGVLLIRSQSRMMGYLNADSPFDPEGWYNTKDLVEEEEGFLKIIGRVGDTINVGGLKFLPSEVERVALRFQGVRLAKAVGKPNPITGQHVELFLELGQNEVAPSLNSIGAFLSASLPSHMVPRRIHLNGVVVSHRYKIG